MIDTLKIKSETKTKWWIVQRSLHFWRGTCGRRTGKHGTGGGGILFLKSSNSNLKKRKGTKNFKDKLDVEVLDVFASPDPTIALKQRTNFGFRVKDTNSGRVYHLCAARHHEKTQWTHKLKRATTILNNIKKSSNAFDDRNSSVEDYSSSAEEEEDDSEAPDYKNSISSIQQLGDAETREVCFFLKLLGGDTEGDRRFEVVISEQEADALTVREIKEQFSETLGAKPDEVILSIDGEVLRDDFRGLEFGLHDGAVIEVKTTAVAPLKTPADRIFTPSDYFDSTNTQEDSLNMNEEKEDGESAAENEDSILGRLSRVRRKKMGKPPPPPPLPPVERLVRIQLLLQLPSQCQKERS